MRVLVLGADGYLGWPTAMYLSARGHDVVAADSLIRRRWDQELGTESLTPIASMEQRIDRWAELTGREIWWQPVDLCDLEATEELIARTRPEGVIHYAEQRSAPYSMISAATRRGDAGQQRGRGRSTCCSRCGSRRRTATW